MRKTLQFVRTGQFTMTGQIEVPADLSPEDTKKVLDAEWSKFLPVSMEYNNEVWTFENN